MKSLKLGFTGIILAFLTACGGNGSVVPKIAIAPVAKGPIVVQRTSYLNYKTFNLSSQKQPRSSTFVKNESVTSGHAYGDFFQDGTISMIAASNVFNGTFNGTTGFGSTDAGRIYFFHTDGKGNWIDQTDKILNGANRTGCISPRKIVVADFNGDKKPDAFIACHGIDGNIPVGYSQGEHPRYILSQPDGTYKNVDAGFNCYCHGAAAADFKGDGYADIIVASPPILGRLVYLKNNRNGTFTDTPSLVPTQTIQKSIWSMEFVDSNRDGKFDLALYGSEHNLVTPGSHPWDWQPTIYLNDGTDTFSDGSGQIKAPFSTNGDAVDIIVGNGKIAFSRSSNNPTNRFQVQILSYPEMKELSITDIGTIDTPFFNLFNGNIVSSWSYNSYSIKF